MEITQISVFLENRKGRLHELCSLLGDNNINIMALTIAETETFGVLRMVTDKPDEALKLLKKSGFTARQTRVLAVEVGNEPGSLARIVKIFDENDANVEYMYAFAHTINDKALLVFKIEDFEQAQKLLRDNGVNLIRMKDFRS
jgi:hypothetical protein